MKFLFRWWSIITIICAIMLSGVDEKTAPEVEPFRIAEQEDPQYFQLPGLAIKTMGRSTQFVKHRHEYIIRLVVSYDVGLTYVMVCVVKPDMSTRCIFNRFGIAFQNYQVFYFKFSWEKYTREHYRK